jgi:hypothetical protein
VNQFIFDLFIVFRKNGANSLNIVNLFKIMAKCIQRKLLTVRDASLCSRGTTWGQHPIVKQFSNLDIVSSVEQKVVGKQLSSSFEQG